MNPALQRLRFLVPGDKLGKYDLIRQIAVGGMAELYLARTVGIEGFEKLVVVKRILPHLADNTSFVKLFLNEARLAATLHHPNIAQVYDIGQEQGEYFFSMEYVHGEDLGRLVASATDSGVPISLDAALTLVAGLCAGLNYAHDKAAPDGKPLNVVHRDVSPSNVLVSYDGAVKLVDFGIARHGSQPSNTRGGIKGKIGYMSPEQCKGQQTLDRRSDIFSIGAILFELTTGRLPFTDETEYGILNQIVNKDVEPPSRIVPTYPKALEAIVMRALARNPDHRYASAVELQGHIEDFAHENRLRVSPLVLSRLMSTLFPARLEEWDHARAQGAFFVEQHVLRTLIESGKTSDSAPAYAAPPAQPGMPDEDTSVSPPPPIGFDNDPTAIQRTPVPGSLRAPTPQPRQPTPPAQLRAVARPPIGPSQIPSVLGRRAATPQPPIVPQAQMPRQPTPQPQPQLAQPLPAPRQPTPQPQPPVQSRQPTPQPLRSAAPFTPRQPTPPQQQHADEAPGTIPGMGPGAMPVVTPARQATPPAATPMAPRQATPPTAMPTPLVQHMQMPGAGTLVSNATPYVGAPAPAGAPVAAYAGEVTERVRVPLSELGQNDTALVQLPKRRLPLIVLGAASTIALVVAAVIVFSGNNPAKQQTAASTPTELTATDEAKPAAEGPAAVPAPAEEAKPAEPTPTITKPVDGPKPTVTPPVEEPRPPVTKPAKVVTPPPVKSTPKRVAKTSPKVIPKPKKVDKPKAEPKKEPKWNADSPFMPVRIEKK